MLLHSVHSQNSLFTRYEALMQSLKEEFNASTSYRLSLQILTLSPYNIEDTKTSFGATRYLVDKARKWKTMYGILPEVPSCSKGKRIETVMVEMVKKCKKC
ncbi:UNVERIFIED_CONTAM: hypothetical protein RMT77_010754 [Armadillidium vulgare]